MQVGLEVGEVNKQGLRGTLATKAFREGEIVAMIPSQATIDVGSYTLPGGVSLLCGPSPCYN